MHLEVVGGIRGAGFSPLQRRNRAMNLMRTGFFFSLSSPKGGEGRGDVVRFSLCPSLRLSPHSSLAGREREREANDATLTLRFIGSQSGTKQLTQIKATPRCSVTMV